MKKILLPDWFCEKCIQLFLGVNLKKEDLEEPARNTCDGCGKDTDCYELPRKLGDWLETGVKFYASCWKCGKKLKIIGSKPTHEGESGLEGIEVQIVPHRCE